MSNVIDIKSGEIKQSTVTVLKDININISSNDIVYLIGKTGSGKSSLLKTLYGELKMFAGTGGVAGFDLNKLKKKDVPNLRRSIGIVFQDFQLLTDRTVLKNLLFVMGASGWKDKTLMEKRAKEVLQLVGIEDKINSMPYALSGGEQQRVSIARALLNKPKLILADEPTGNLDPETSEEIMRLLDDLHKAGNTIVVVTHEEDIAKMCSRIVRLKDGIIVEDKKNKMQKAI